MIERNAMCMNEPFFPVPSIMLMKKVGFLFDLLMKALCFPFSVFTLNLKKQRMLPWEFVAGHFSSVIVYLLSDVIN